MFINLNKINVLNLNTVNTKGQCSIRYSNLAPLTQDTVSFSGRGKLIAESMVDAPTERTCRQVELNAEPARFYLETVLDKYLKPLTQNSSDPNSKEFPILDYRTKIKKSTSIREKVVSKYSKIYNSEADAFSNKVVDELLKYFKLSNGITREQVVKEAKNKIAQKVPPYEFVSYYLSIIMDSFIENRRFDFSNYSNEFINQILGQITEALEDSPKSKHTEGSAYIEPTSIKGVKHYANDIVGARITMKESDPEYTKFVLDALKCAVKNGDLKITSIENNLPDPKKLPAGRTISDFEYAKDYQLRSLAREARAELINNKSKSGYIGIHINVDLSSPLFSCYNGIFDGYSGEIQILGADVEKLKDVEDLCYKLKDDKNAIQSKYKPFKTHFKQYYNDETKDAFDDYTYALYLAQRMVPPHSKKGDDFPSIAELGFEGKVPKELDFNYLKSLKEKCDSYAEIQEKQEETQDNSKNHHTETLKSIRHNGDIKTVKRMIAYYIKS